MKKYVFDSYPFIALFRQETGFEIVRDVLVKLSKAELEGYTTAINLVEVYYMISRKSNSKQADSAVAAILEMPVLIVEPDLKMCLDAAKLKSRYSLSFADAFAAALTIDKQGILLTGDDEFKSLNKEPGFKVHYL